MKQRRVTPRIVYQGTDISRDIAPFLVSLSYYDYAEGQADELEILLHDRDGLWWSDWYPVKGDTIRAELECMAWGADREDITLPLGLFEVDEITLSGPPSRVRIMSHSAVITESMREKRTRAWENADLAAIASQIAYEHGLGTLLQLDSPPAYERVDQTEQGDLEFLERLCKPHNLYLKLAENKLILSSQEKLEEVMAGSIDRRGRDVISWSFRDKTHEIYKACKVTYWDPDLKSEHTHIEKDPYAVTGDTLVVNERVGSLAEAMTRARAELARANKTECTGDITLHGRPDLAAGVSTALFGFGAVSGKHFIEQTTHMYSRQGYTTKLSLRRVRGS